MAPIKFEENIKDKLEKRSIEPSSEAWSQLSAQLDAHDKKNSRSWFLYIGIAASIVGVLLVTTLFFKSSENQIVSPTLVETEISEPVNQTKQEQHAPELSVQENVAVDNISNDEMKNSEGVTTEQQLMTSLKQNKDKVAHISEETQISETKKTSITKASSIVDNLKSLDTRIALNASNDPKDAVEKTAIATSSLTPEELKVLKVVNQIKALDSDGTAATDEEIETLLKRAERDILKERIYNETTRTVDADALLQDVEDDLDQSFRTKVFEALKSSYNTVKTAVAERNN